MTFSVRSVGILLARLGQTTQTIPSGATADFRASTSSTAQRRTE